MRREQSMREDIDDTGVKSVKDWPLSLLVGQALHLGAAKHEYIASFRKKTERV